MCGSGLKVKQSILLVFVLAFLQPCFLFGQEEIILTQEEAQELIMQIDNSKKALEEAKNSLKESQKNLQRAGDAITRAEESLSTAEDIVRRGIDRARKEK